MSTTQDGSLILGIDFNASTSLINSQLTDLEKKINTLDVKVGIDGNEINKLKETLANSSFLKAGASAGQKIGQNLSKGINSGFKINYDKNSEKISSQIMDSLGLSGSRLQGKIQKQVKGLLQSVNTELMGGLSSGKTNLSSDEITNFSKALKETLSTAQQNLNTKTDNIKTELQNLKTTYSGFLDYFKNNPIKMTDNFALELKGLNEYQDAMKIKLGDSSLFSRKAGMDLNGSWDEVSKASNGILDINTSSDQDQLLSVINALKDYRTQRQNLLDQMKANRLTPQELTGISDSSDDWVTGILNSTVQAFEKKKQQLEQEVSQIKTTIGDLGVPKSFSNTKDVLKEVKESFNGLGKINFSWIKDTDDEITGFTAELKNAQGIVENFKYSLNDKGTKFNLFGISGSDTNTNKIEQTISKYEKLFAELKKTSLSDSKLGTGLSSEMEAFNTALTNLKNRTGSISDVEQKFNSLQASVSNVVSNLIPFGSSLNKIDQASNNISKMPTTIKALEVSFEQLKTQPEAVKNSLQGLTTQLQKVKQVETTNGKGKEWSEEYKELAKSVQAVTEKINLLKKEEEQVNNKSSFTNERDNLLSNMDAYATRSSKMFSSLSPQAKELKERFIELRKEIENCGDGSELKGLKKQLSTLKNDVATAGLNTKSFSDVMKDDFSKFTQFYLAGGIFVQLANEAKQMVNAVIEIDTAMTNLRKVTDETDIAYNNFLDNATEKAKVLGTTISAFIDLTADFSRLGFTMPEATDLAEVATLYQKVGDGLSTEDASSSIISTMKAFNIEAKDSITIIDALNEVGNNYAISSAGIGEALQRSASALYEGNNDLSQSIGLIVGANNVLQDPSAVGNMWKTVSLRIRGAKTELEEAGLETDNMVESTSTLQGLVKGMTGFDILEADGKTFKSTYDIIVGIGEEYQKLEDIDQASLLEALSGKRQANALASALNNIDDIVGAYGTAEESAGSAQKEFDNYANSIQHSLDVLSASFQQLSSNTLDSAWVKGIVDLGNVIVNVVDKIGILQIALIALSAKLGATTSLGLNSFANSLITMAQNMGIASASATTLGTALSVAIPVAGIVLGITAIVKIYDALNVSMEEQIAIAEKAKQTYETEKANLESINSELEEQQKLMDDLTNKDSLTYVEQQELEKLQKVTQQLLIQKDLAEKATRDAQEKSAIEASKVIGKYDGVSDIENKTNEYGKYTDSNAGLVSDSNNLASMIAGYKKFNELLDEAYNDKDAHYIEHFTELTDGVSESIWGTVSELQTQQASMQEYYDYLQTLDAKTLTGEQKKIIASYDNVSKAIEYTYSQLDPVTWAKMQQEIADSTEETADAVTSSTSKTYESISSLLNTEGVSEYVSQLEDTVSKVDSAIKSISEGKELSNSDLLELVKEVGLDISNIDLTNLEGLKNKLLAIKDTKLEDTLSALKSSGSFSTSDYETLEKVLRGVATEGEKATESTKSLDDALSSLKSSADVVNDVNEEIKDMKKISVDSLQSIVKTFPELEGAVAKYQAGLISAEEMFALLEEAYNNDKDNYLDLLALKLEKDNDFYSKICQNSSEWQKVAGSIYGDDYKNWENVANAKLEIDNNLIKTLSGNWNKYFKAVKDEQTGLYSLENTGEIGENEDTMTLNEDGSITSGMSKEKRLNLKLAGKAVDNSNSALKALTSGSDLQMNLTGYDWKSTSQSGSDKAKEDKDSKTEIDYISNSLENLRRNVDSAQTILDNLESNGSDSYYTDKANAIDKLTKSYKAYLGSAKKETGLYGAKAEYEDLYDNELSKLGKYKGSIQKKIESGETFEIKAYGSENAGIIQKAMGYYSNIKETENEILDTKQKIKDNDTEALNLELERLQLVSDTSEAQKEQATSVKDKNAIVDKQLKNLEAQYEINKKLAKSEEERTKLQEQYENDTNQLNVEKLTNTKDDYQTQYDNNQAQLDSGTLSIKEQNNLFDKQKDLLAKIHNKELAIAELEGATKNDIEAINSDFTDKLNSLNDSQKELNLKQLENAISIQETSISYLEKELDLRKSIGDTITESDYDMIIGKQKIIKSNYESLLKTAEAELATMKVGSDEWYSQLTKVTDLEGKIQDCNSALITYSDTLRSLPYENFDEGITKIGEIRNEFEDLTDLLGEKLDDSGNLTSDGLTYIGLLGKEINTYEAEIKSYNNTLYDLQQKIANATTQSDYDYYSELYTKYSDSLRESAKNLKSAKDEIVNLNIDKLEAEKDAFSKVIEKQKEFVEAEKEAYELSKKQADQNKTLANLRAKIAILEANTNDTDRTNMSMLAKLRAELASQEADAEEERITDSYDAQLDALDKANDDYEKAQDEKIKELETSQKAQEAVVSNSLSSVQSNYSSVLSNISSMANDYSITLSENLISPWKTAQTEIQNYIDLVNTIGQNLPKFDNTTVESITSTGRIGASVGESGGSASVGLGAGTALANKWLDGLDKTTILSRISSSHGYGDNTSSLNQYVMSKYGKSLGYKDMADVMNLISGTNYTDSDFKGNTTLKNSLLNKLKLAGFSKGGTIVDKINQQISANNDDVVVTAKVGESIIDANTVTLLKDSIPKISSLTSSLMDSNNINRLGGAGNVNVQSDSLCRIEIQGNTDDNTLKQIKQYIKTEGVNDISKALKRK